MAQQLFELTFLFECDSAGIAALEQKVAEAIEKERAQIKMKLASVSSTAAQLSLHGERKVIDSAHGKLSKDVLRDCRSLRLVDELGEELRIEGYCIIAKIEPRLRRFINEAMTEVLGFSWWEKLADEAMKERVDQVGMKNQKSELSHHPIEFSEFEHLVRIITGELAHWTVDQKLTVSDLAQLLNASADLKALKAEIDKRVKPECLWDNVFAKLFADQQSWLSAKDDLLKTVIPIRHKISHHRPIRVHEIEQLRKAAASVHAALDAKPRRLQNQEQKNLHDQAKTLLGRAERIRPVFDFSVAPASHDVQEALKNAYSGPSKELNEVLRSVLDFPAETASSAVQDAIKSALRGPAVASKTLNELLRSALDVPTAAGSSALQKALSLANPMSVFADVTDIDDSTSPMNTRSDDDLATTSDQKKSEMANEVEDQVPPN